MKIKLTADFSGAQLSSPLDNRRFSREWDSESLSESPFYMREGKFKGSTVIPFEGCKYCLPLNSGYSIEFKSRDITLEENVMSVLMSDILVSRNNTTHPELVPGSIVDILVCNGKFLAA